MSAWDRLDTENDLFVLTGLLFEWLEHLRSPVIGKDAMTYAVIHCDDIEKAMSKVFDFLFNVKLRCFSFWFLFCRKNISKQLFSLIFRFRSALLLFWSTSFDFWLA